MSVSFKQGQAIVVVVTPKKGPIEVYQDSVRKVTDKWIWSKSTNRAVPVGKTAHGGVSFFSPETYAGLASAQDYRTEALRIIDEEPRLMWPELYHALADLIMEEQSSAPAVREQELADIQEVVDEPELATA